jgi:hypothetical protein
LNFWISKPTKPIFAPKPETSLLFRPLNGILPTATFGRERKICDIVARSLKEWSTHSVKAKKKFKDTQDDWLGTKLL